MKIIQEITDLLSMTQDQVLEHIDSKATFRHTASNYRIYSRNDTPKPMLCVHLDTINDMVALHEPQITDFEYDDTLGILGLSSSSKLSCLGADDRAGLWIALEIIDYMETSGNYSYDVGFFCDEEIGCIGSTAFSTDISDDYNTTCYIGLDRRSNKGAQEVATYGYDSKQLIELYTSNGYPEVQGSITDASNLASSCDLACVNLSVGYDNEHTKNEVLYIDCMVDTLATLKAIHPGYTAYKSEFKPMLSTYGGFMMDDYYIEELEYENKALRAFVESLGFNADEMIDDWIEDV